MNNKTTHKQHSFFISGFFLLCLLPSLLWAKATDSKLLIEHAISVKFQPESARLEVLDELKLPPSLQSGALEFLLNSAFRVTVEGKLLKPQDHWQGNAVYRLNDAGETLRLQYRGELQSSNNCNWLTESCLKADEQGLFLSASSGWYPRFADSFHRFKLESQLPENWVSISQGESLGGNQWQELQPQDSIYLIAAAFHRYSQTKDGVAAQVYLLQPDEALAQQYLNATHRYIQSYSALLGAYPYQKFATVESFWQSGWGMPSFTLLGSRVMRLPFILYTSFPHEIVHNWWGNGVYTDITSGNWSEGLTAYLSDQRMRELKGDGAAYRRDQLKKYALFSQDGKDFPLSQFVSRHDHRSQAIGYGKSMMLFHMLRMRLGEDDFYAGLKAFFREYRFREASFNQLLDYIGQFAGIDVADYRQHWLNRSGAPKIQLADARLRSDSSGKAGEITLQQVQAAKIFPVRIPLQFTLANQRTEVKWLEMAQRKATFEFQFDAPVCKVQVDPEFDSLRIPQLDEYPPSLNQLFVQSKKPLLVGGPEKAWLRELKPLLQQIGGHSVIQPEKSGNAAGKQPVLWLGTPQSLPAEVKALLSWQNGMPVFNGKPLHADNQVAVATFMISGKHFYWLHAPDISAAQKVLRKIRHYGKYSYLVFDAESAKNQGKGQWQVSPDSMQATLAACTVPD